MVTRLRLRPVGQHVAIFGGVSPVDGVIVGYTLVSLWRPEVTNLTEDGWAQGYLVRLEEACDTPHGIHIREVAVLEDDLTTDPRR